MSSSLPVTRRTLLSRAAAGLAVGLPAAGRLQATPAQAGAPPRQLQPPSPSKQRRVTPAAPPGPLVMLDPGHGGKDPGAIGFSGAYEKHVAFAAATELRRQLLASGRYRVEMTRANDVFIPLDGRVEHAQTRGAALFVSIHADAIHDPHVRGASVYTLATSASDAQTAALARRENSADRFAGPRFHTASPEVAAILASLVRQETRVGSARMAQAVVGALDQSLPMLPNPARHAGFVVLKAPDIPSVLVEMGFMSNPQDEALLRQAAHRARVASAMMRAIDAFLSPHSLPGAPVSGARLRMAG